MVAPISAQEPPLPLPYYAVQYIIFIYYFHVKKMGL